VLAHEIAHNTMKHMDAKRTNASVGSILDIAAAIYGVNTHGMFGGLAGNAHSKGFESEADYVGLYLMTRAGLPIDDAPTFWRRMAANNPASIRGGYLATHPATPERFVALEQTIAEIRDKQARGEPLVPNRKRGERETTEGNQ
jgi:predicted Zn-dependent protease